MSDLSFFREICETKACGTSQPNISKILKKLGIKYRLYCGKKYSFITKNLDDDTIILFNFCFQKKPFRGHYACLIKKGKKIIGINYRKNRTTKWLNYPKNELKKNANAPYADTYFWVIKKK